MQNEAAHDRSYPTGRPISYDSTFLAIKQTHAWQVGGVLPAERFDLDLDRTPYCPTIEEFDRFKRRHPEWGMPYSFLPVSERVRGVLTR